MVQAVLPLSEKLRCDIRISENIGLKCFAAQKMNTVLCDRNTSLELYLSSESLGRLMYWLLRG